MRQRLGSFALVLVFIAACGGPRSGLGTTAGSCFRALPAAAAAVHGKGEIVGVRRVRPSAVASQLPEAARFGDLCLVAFKGDFQPGEVEGSRSQRAARFAIVAVSSRTLKPVGAFVVDRLPFRFQHRV